MLAGGGRRTLDPSVFSYQPNRKLLPNLHSSTVSSDELNSVLDVIDNARDGGSNGDVKSLETRVSAYSSEGERRGLKDDSILFAHTPERDLSTVPTHDPAVSTDASTVERISSPSSLSASSSSAPSCSSPSSNSNVERTSRRMLTPLCAARSNGSTQSTLKFHVKSYTPSRNEEFQALYGSLALPSKSCSNDLKKKQGSSLVCVPGRLKRPKYCSFSPISEGSAGRRRDDLEEGGLSSGSSSPFLKKAEFKADDDITGKAAKSLHASTSSKGSMCATTRPNTHGDDVPKHPMRNGRRLLKKESLISSLQGEDSGDSSDWKGDSSIVEKEAQRARQRNPLNECKSGVYIHPNGLEKEATHEHSDNIAQSGRRVALKKLKGYADEGNTEESSSDESNDSEDSRAGLDELKECLNVSSEMTAKIVSALGGSVPANHQVISESIGDGRCHACRTFNLPTNFAKHCSKAFSNLKEYQKCGVHWLLALHESDRDGILADEMGLGKTAQTCVFLNYLYSSGKITAPTLLAVPASLLDNWINEINIWAEYLRGRVLKYHGKQLDRRHLMIDFLSRYEEQSEDQFLVLLTSINTLASRWDLQYLKQLEKCAYLVVDEAHALKNRNSLMHKRLNKAICCERRLLLTGSPVQNHLRELQNLFLFVMPHVFDDFTLEAALNSFSRHTLACEKALGLKRGSEVFNTSLKEEKEVKSSVNHLLGDMWSLIQRKITGDQESSSQPAQVQCLQRILAPFILRRLKSEVLGDLPRKHSIVIRCNMSGKQLKMYRKEITGEMSKFVLKIAKDEDETNTSDAATSVMSDEAAKKLESSEVLCEKASSVDNILDMDNLKDTDRLPANLEGFDADVTAFDALLSLGDEKKFPSASSSSSSSLFVRSLLFRLRRICNHPLMMHGFYYSNRQIEELIDYYQKRVDGFIGKPRKKVAEEIRKWSDFQIFQDLQSLISLDHKSHKHSLQPYIIPKELYLESTKIRKMLELIKTVYEKKEKALIFSQFTSYLDLIEEVLTQYLPHIQATRLDGATKVLDRQGIVSAFNEDPEISLFLLSTKAGGQGLNLTAARTVILMDQDWNPHTDRQAEDRVHRLGQTEEVTVYRLCCKNTIEEAILRCCQKKLNLDEAFGGNTDVLQRALLKESIADFGNSKEDEPE